MQLTSQQRRQLQKLRDYQQTPPTISSLFRNGWRACLYVTTVGFIGIGFFLWAGWPIASGLFAGMILGTIARDVGWYRRLGSLGRCNEKSRTGSESSSFWSSRMA